MISEGYQISQELSESFDLGMSFIKNVLNTMMDIIILVYFLHFTSNVLNASAIQPHKLKPWVMTTLIIKTLGLSNLDF
jgi:hypothetical protein